MFKKKRTMPPRLTYPTRTIGAGTQAVEEYVIPEEDKARVLNDLYPFEPVPELTEMMFDLHEEKLFQVRDYLVLRGQDMDLLVSPYFFNSGGTVIDWMPQDFKPGETLARKIRGESISVLTIPAGPQPTCH
jgi:hypothetical protein